MKAFENGDTTNNNPSTKSEWIGYQFDRHPINRIISINPSSLETQVYHSLSRDLAQSFIHNIPPGTKTPKIDIIGQRKPTDAQTDLSTRRIWRIINNYDYEMKSMVQI